MEQRKDEMVITLDGTDWTYIEIAEKHGVSVQAIARRVNAGWSAQDIVTMPKGRSPTRLTTKLHARLTKENERRKQMIDEYGHIPSMHEALTMRWVK